ncbi:MAG: alpha/beta hydrolase [Acidobacteria bacterium]|nr:alpha/beta hydrolase [Acidobacteriota bacterium]
MIEKKIAIKGVEWEYTTGGRGERAVLMFHGAVGGAEGVGWLADALSAEAAERVRLVKERLKDYFDNRLTKDVLLSRVALSVDFCKNESYSPADFENWPGRVLIIESANDPMINAEERRRLREAYPRALVCVFEDAGHLIPLLRLEELVGVIRAFMYEDYARPETIEQCSIHEEC